jgi:hypothetical protein
MRGDTGVPFPPLWGPFLPLPQQRLTRPCGREDAGM